MTKIIDSVFGELTDYEECSAIKKEEITLFEQKYTVEITVDYVDDKIVDSQREFYKKFQDILISKNDLIIKAIQKYSAKHYPANDVYYKAVGMDPFDKTSMPADYLQPTTVLFQEKSWGILCETPYEQEEGFAFWFATKTKSKVHTDTILAFSTF